MLIEMKRTNKIEHIHLPQITIYLCASFRILKRGVRFFPSFRTLRSIS